MAKYKRYKNSLEMFLDSKRGKRLLNFMYSWGAAVVVIGALFKLLHLPFGNQMLFVGMITEFFVFFISGFEQPEEQYHWDRIFPELSSSNPLDRKEIEKAKQDLIKQVARSQERINSPKFSEAMPLTIEYSGFEQPKNEGDVERLSNSIDRLCQAADQLARLGQVSESMAQQWESLHQIDIQSMEKDTHLYQDQLQSLSKNIQGLNTIYEIQLKGISSQIDTIDHINSGLQRIRNMYDSTVVDSSTFQKENEKMASQLSELNAVYARILTALTVNVGSGIERPNL